jgi:hypothetical protein
MQKFFAIAGVAGLLLFVPARADASCCDQSKAAMHDMKGACCDMPCCAHAAAAEPSAIEMLLSMDPQFTPAPPAVQKTEIWFQRPVMVGRSILQGRYVIEHDNDRMARGEPCTHIYAYNDQTKPVVTFHCTHLERGRASANTAVLATIGDGTMQKLTEFQFAGETASHGVPNGR